MEKAPSLHIILPELTFHTSRSSGPGGQNVNKVNSKVTLRWNIGKSEVINEVQRAMILERLASRINNEGELLIVSQEKRSQTENKKDVITRLEKLMAKVFERKKIRKATAPSRSSREKRLEGKKRQSEKKVQRGQRFSGY